MKVSCALTRPDPTLLHPSHVPVERRYRRRGNLDQDCCRHTRCRGRTVPLLTLVSVQKRVREKTAPHAPDSPLKMLKRKGENCKKRECWAHQMEDSRITNFGSFCVAVCLVASLLSNLSCNFANVKKSLPPQIYSYQCLRIWGLALLFASAMLPNTCGGFALVLENRFSLQNKLVVCKLFSFGCILVVFFFLNIFI